MADITDVICNRVKPHQRKSIALAGGALTREHECGSVVAPGGGSGMDTAKAIAAVATNGGDPRDHAAGTGKGQPIRNRPLLILAITVSVILILAVCAFLPTGGAAQAASPLNLKLRMSFAGGDVLVSLYDTQATRELVAMLPLTLTFEDYARTEKIAYLPKKLSSSASLSSSQQGDFAYYAPWGNLAVFYSGYGSAAGLHILGKIESGKEELTNMKRDFTAVLEILKQ